MGEEEDPPSRPPPPPKYPPGDGPLPTPLTRLPHRSPLPFPPRLLPPLSYRRRRLWRRPAEHRTRRKADRRTTPTQRVAGGALSPSPPLVRGPNRAAMSRVRRMTTTREMPDGSPSGVRKAPPPPLSLLQWPPVGAMWGVAPSSPIQKKGKNAPGWTLLWRRMTTLSAALPHPHDDAVRVRSRPPPPRRPLLHSPHHPHTLLLFVFPLPPILLLPPPFWYPFPLLVLPRRFASPPKRKWRPFPHPIPPVVDRLTRRGAWRSLQ